MDRFWRWRWLLVVGWWLLGVQATWAAAAVFSEELDTDLYNCTVTMTPSPTQSATAAVRLLLEAEAGRAVRVTFTRGQCTVETLDGKRATRSGQVALPLPAGKPATVTLLRRGEMLGVLQGDELRFHGRVPQAPGARGTVEAERGGTGVQATVQRLEPVIFADNFMRTASESGGWRVQRGRWGLQSAWDRDPKGGRFCFVNASYAQNPFAWAGAAPDAGSALCTVGKPFWEDYTLTVAVRPAAGGAVGLAVNQVDATHGLLVRWSPVNDRSATGNRLILYRQDGDKRQLLAEVPGGYFPGQWYQLSVVSSLEGIRVLVDGQERLAQTDVTPRYGGVGLYVEGTDEVTFDDVTVYGRTLKRDLIAEHAQARYSERYQVDPKGMASWSTSAADWQPFPGVPGYRLHRWDYFGEHWMTATVTPDAQPNGELALLLCTDGKEVSTGYRAVLKREAGQLLCTLWRGTDKLAERKSLVMGAGTDYTVRLRTTGKYLVLECDGETVLRAAVPAPAPGFRPAFRAEGCFAGAREVLVLGRQVLDYSFADAPTDWMGEGTWMATTRWSCSPQWSFLGGWSRGDAVLWHKQRFVGDQSFEVVCAPKMEYPRERLTYEHHFRDLCLTICGDGHNPRSGYTIIHGATDAQGTFNQRTVLLRNGVEVASVPVGVVSHNQGGHTHWYGLALHKRGAQLEFWSEGRRVLTYTDPEPLSGGVPAVWTMDNGLALARARLHFAQAPQPRQDAHVLLDTPWYPEWANLGQRLTLAFPQACATSGEPVRLQVTPHQTPEDGTSAPGIEGTNLHFTPAKTGKYWYEVRAAAGAQTSPAFHLALPVFNPALGRNDAQAVVLYRFDETAGDVVHDRAPLGPPADLLIPKEATVQWLPGQGLTLHGANRIRTAGDVPKLMTLAEKKACTFEFWISNDTIFPPSDWLGYLLTWEKPGEPARNLAVATMREYLLVMPRGTVLQPQGILHYHQRLPVLFFPGVRTGLIHLVVVWDGQVTRCYMNGERRVDRAFDWQSERWAPNAPLMLGNQLNPQARITDEYARFMQVAPYILNASYTGQHAYLGTFYLAAIHARAFTQEEVQRHYQAGPSAR